MNILLTIYNTPAWELLANAVGVAATENLPSKKTDTQTLLRPIQKIPTLLELAPADSEMLFCGVVQAEYYIAYAVENGSSIESAATRWQAKTEELLAKQRQHRKNIKLFNIHQALHEPKKFQEALSQHLTIHNYLPHKDESSLALLAACQYVSQTPELKALNTLLQASAIALQENEQLLVDVDNILGIQRTQTTELAAVNSEYDQLQQQAEQIQEILNQANARYEQLQTSQQQSEATLQQRESQHKDVAEERDLILSQLHVVQEQLESYYLQLQSEQQQNRHTLIAHEKQSAKELEKLEIQLRRAKAKAAGVEYNKNILEQELHKMRSSIVWRSAAPLRAVRRIGKKTDPAHQQLQQQIALLLTSEYFDIEWYLKHYPDVAESQMNPAEHYILFGAAEGRLPSLHFDGNWYLQHYPDIAGAGLNPLLHFIMFGQEEGRTSSPKLLANNGQSTGE